MARGGLRKSTKPKRKRTAPYNMADDYEIEKHREDTEKFLKKLNKDGTPLKPLTESQVMSIVRGAIREKWMYAPNKLAYLNLGIVPDEDLSSRRRWKCQCEYCHEWFGKGDIQVDHLVGEHQLKTPDDLLEFYDSICNVGFDQMKRTCIPCHEIKTTMERYGITDEKEAKAVKEAIRFENNNPKAADQKRFLLNKGFKASDVKNATTRRESLIEYFKGLQ